MIIAELKAKSTMPSTSSRLSATNGPNILVSEQEKSDALLARKLFEKEAELKAYLLEEVDHKIPNRE